MGPEESRGLLGGTIRVLDGLGQPARVPNGLEGSSRVRDILGGSRIILGVLGRLCVGLELSRWVNFGF